MTAVATNYVPEIQGLRALAVVLVVLFHAGLPVTGGYIGVDVFFVISGFVITGAIQRAAQTGTFSLANFYVRRIRRLMPALAVTLVTTALLHIGFGPEASLLTTAKTAVAAALLNANHFLFQSAGYFEPVAEQNALLHTWSLSVEEQFYLVFPSLLVTAGTLRPRARQLVGALTVLSFLTGLFVVFLPSTAGIDLARLAFYTSFTRAWEFGLGALLALSPSAVSRLPDRVRHIGGLLGLGAILFSALTYDHTQVFPGYAALLPVLGTAALLIALLNPHTLLARLFRFSVATRLGDLSYAWYLWHWPLIVFARASFPSQPFAPILAATIALGLAWLTERWVERPIRNRPIDAQRPTWVLALICVGAPLAAWPLVGLSRQVSDGTPVLQALRATIAASDAVPCKDGLRPSKVGPECRWGDGRGVVFVGDSNAHQFVPYFKATHPHGRATTMLGCPFVDTPNFRDGRRHKRCENFVENTLRDIADIKPHTVYIGMATDAYIQEPRFVFASPHGSTKAADKTLLLQMSLSEITRNLRKAGVARIILIQPIPKFVDSAGQPLTMGADCSWWGLVHDPTCTPSIRRPAKPGAPFYDRIPDAHVVDFGPLICPNGTCRAWQDGVWRYRDATHLSQSMGTTIPLSTTPTANTPY